MHSTVLYAHLDRCNFGCSCLCSREFPFLSTGILSSHIKSILTEITEKKRTLKIIMANLHLLWTLYCFAYAVGAGCRWHPMLVPPSCILQSHCSFKNTRGTPSIMNGDVLFLCSSFLFCIMTAIKTWLFSYRSLPNIRVGFRTNRLLFS